MACFDKTGTLTEDGLDFMGLKRSDDLTGKMVRDPKTELGEKSILLQAIASCHSLTMIHGELLGDPLDIKMFRRKKLHL